MAIDYRRLSKTISHALRHAPEVYGLVLDDEGWVPVADLLAALCQRRLEWCRVREDDLVRMNARATKRRFEIQAGKIRAYYGHSVSDKIHRPPAEPPPVLYHGTAPETARLILAEGIKSMSRQHVHLSSDRHTAQMVGQRHARKPVILEIRAQAAFQAGVNFYLGNEDVWLADTIPPQFIEFGE